MQYATFFVPSKRRSLGAIDTHLFAPPSADTTISKVAPNVLTQQFNAPSPVSSGVAGRILDLGPVGIIGLVAVTAVAGYFIVKKVSR